MVFSDKDIKEAINNGIIGIDPYFEKDVQPASVDLHLDKKLLIFNNSSAPFIDLKKELPDLNEPIIIQGDEPFFNVDTLNVDLSNEITNFYTEVKDIEEIFDPNCV